MKIDRETFGKFFNGTPGKEWDDYASRLRNAAAGEVDERGYSLADEFDGVDGVAEGGSARSSHACRAREIRDARGTINVPGDR